jgi:hypothetical protein
MMQMEIPQQGIGTPQLELVALLTTILLFNGFI